MTTVSRHEQSGNVVAITTELVGKGLYSDSEAGRLLRVSPPTIKRWARGHVYQTHGKQRISPPIIRLELRERGPEAPLTFLDLIELKFVSMFRSAGVSMYVVRAAWERAATRFDSDHPFSMDRFRTDGKRIFLELPEHTEELPKTQMVFPEVIEPFLLQLEWDDNQVNRYWPMGTDGRIVLDPRRSFGKPIDHETGVPTFILYQASLSGETMEEVAYWYDVPVEAVRKSVDYEKSLLAS